MLDVPFFPSCIFQPQHLIASIRGSTWLVGVLRVLAVNPLRGLRGSTRRGRVDGCGLLGQVAGFGAEPWRGGRPEFLLVSSACRPMRRALWCGRPACFWI